MGIELANTELRRWIAETADQRVIREIDARPVERLVADRAALGALPNTAPLTDDLRPASWPREPLQRSPRVYQHLFEVAA